MKLRVWCSVRYASADNPSIELPQQLLTSPGPNNISSSLRFGRTAIRCPLLLLSGRRTAPCNSVMDAPCITHLLTTQKLRFGRAAICCPLLLLSGICIAPCNFVMGAQCITHLLTTHKRANRCHQDFIISTSDFPTAPAIPTTIQSWLYVADVHPVSVVRTANVQRFGICASCLTGLNGSGGEDIGRFGPLPLCACRQ